MIEQNTNNNYRERNNYKERILKCLNQSPAPVDVEKIRKSCKIANWNTTLKHCLELVFEGNIKGQTTSKGWVFWAHQETSLEPWQEAVGTLDKLETSETQTIALLTCNYEKQLAIALPKDQRETEELNTLIGRKISILKTDNPQKPIIIKVAKGTRLLKSRLRSKIFGRIEGFVKRWPLFSAMSTCLKSGYL